MAGPSKKVPDSDSDSDSREEDASDSEEEMVAADSDLSSDSSSSESDAETAAPRKKVKVTAAPKAKTASKDLQPTPTASPAPKKTKKVLADSSDEEEVVPPSTAKKVASTATPQKAPLQKKKAAESSDDDDDDDAAEAKASKKPAARAKGADADTDSDSDSDSGGAAAASSAKAATAAEAKEGVIRPLAYYCATAKDGSQIRAAAVLNTALSYSVPDGAILDHTDANLAQTVMMIMPGDAAEAIGLPDGVMRARGIARDPAVKDRRRLVDFGPRHSGSVALTVADVCTWLRGIGGMAKETYDDFEAVLRDPSCYEEVLTRSKMKTLGARVIPRTPNANPKSKRKSGAAKRKADAAANDDEGEGDFEASARVYKRSRSHNESAIFIGLLGQAMVDAAMKFIQQASEVQDADSEEDDE